MFIFKKEDKKRVAIFKTGFTLLESLLVLGVITLVAGFCLRPFISARNSQILNSETEKAVSILNEAKSMSQAAVNSSNYGVYFETNKAVLFRGDVYNEENVSNREFIFDSKVQLININFMSYQTVVFDKMMGTVSRPGSFTIRLLSDTSKLKNINISASGVISID